MVEQGSNSYSTYRKWKSGRIEQWGSLSTVSMDFITLVTLPISFTDPNYYVFIQSTGGVRKNDEYANGTSVYEKSLDKFWLYTWDYEFGRYWYACGY